MKAFISYSSADLEFVIQLAKDLKSHGVRVWLDEWEIKVGDEIRQKIEHGIAEYDYFVIVLSHHSVASTWVERELSAAFMKEVNTKRIVVLPIKIEECSIPPLISGKRFADFSKSYERGINELLRVLVPDPLSPPGKPSTNMLIVNDESSLYTNSKSPEQPLGFQEENKDKVVTHSASNGVSFLSQIKNHKRGLIILLTILIITAGFVFYYFFHLSPAEKVFLEGKKETSRGNYQGAILYFKQAVNLDANFIYAHSALAVAYGNTHQPGLAAQSAETAFNLLDLNNVPVTDLDRLRIEYFYHAFRTGNSDEQFKVLERWREQDRQDPGVPSNKIDSYIETGKFQEAIDAANNYLVQNKDSVNAHIHKGWALIHLGFYNDAKVVFKDALDQKLDSPDFHTALYIIAFIENDHKAMEEQAKLMISKEGETNDYILQNWEADKEAFAGHWKEAKALSVKSINHLPNELEGTALHYNAKAALRSAIFKKCDEVEKETKNLPYIYSDYDAVWLTRTALALTLCGKFSEAQSRVDVLESKHSQNTLVKYVWLPTIALARQLSIKGNNNRELEQAINLLKPDFHYEAVAEFWPQYLRGLAYLRLGLSQEAIAEFKKIANDKYRGQAPISPLYPLAYLGLARAYKLAHKPEDSYKAYQDFRNLWPNPNDDLPIFTEAEREFGKLKKKG